MQIEAVRALEGVGKVAVAQSKHVEMLVDRQLSGLVCGLKLLLHQIQVVKPDWHRRYNMTLVICIMMIMLPRSLCLFNMMFMM